MMKKIALIGFNIFAAGGTSQSNLNLIAEFAEAGYASFFYNYQAFSSRDVRKLKKAHKEVAKCEFREFSDLTKLGKVDFVFITREEFFCLAPFIAQTTDAKIIAEVHAPMMTIKVADVQPYLPYISCVRVATEKSKRLFSKKFGFNRIYVQTVSVRHIDTTTSKFKADLVDSEGFVNFHVLARFDYIKDIEYSIRLMDYLVNYRQNIKYRFYINGYGPGLKNYQDLIDAYHLERNVFINKRVPENHIYLCTSRAETFGYSIVEQFASGHAVILYSGDDGVLRENFGSYSNCLWIDKFVDEDAKHIVDFVSHPLSETGYVDNLTKISQIKTGFVRRFERNTEKFKLPVKPENFCRFSEIQTTIENKLNFDNLRGLRLTYYKLKSIPVIGTFLNSERLRRILIRLVREIKPAPKMNQIITPDENKFFIEAFHGTTFAGDPKYFALAIKERNPEAEFFVSSTNQLVDNEIANYGFTPVRVGSMEYITKFKSSKYIFINGNSLDKVGKSPEQVFVQTWHGFPLKKMVNDLENQVQREKESTAFTPRMQKWDFLTTSSNLNTKLLTSAFKLNDNSKLTILSQGTPKNEYLLKNKGNMAERKKIFEKYFNRPFDVHSKFILFCPTWRKEKRRSVSDVDLIEVIRSLPDNYEMIVKLHPNEGNLRDDYAQLDSRIHCFYNEVVDIQELYLLADVLVSDYSSAMFDFALLDKPIIVLQEDEADYAKNIGWYFDISKLIGLKGEKMSASVLADRILSPESDLIYDKKIHTKLLSNEHIGSTDYELDRIFNADER